MMTHWCEISCMKDHSFLEAKNIFGFSSNLSEFYGNHLRVIHQLLNVLPSNEKQNELADRLFRPEIHSCFKHRQNFVLMTVVFAQ